MSASFPLSRVGVKLSPKGPTASIPSEEVADLALEIQNFGDADVHFKVCWAVLACEGYTCGAAYMSRLARHVA